MQNKKYSFFIGRFQPLHAGHIALFDKVRKEDKHIAVGIQNTEVDDDNPYTFGQRVRMFDEYVPDAELWPVPVINEICYGRDVGYGMRAINLPTEIEKISATRIRAKKGPHPLVQHKKPTAYSDSELEVLKAVDKYKIANNIKFLDVTQIFSVIKDLGYRKGEE